MGASRGALVRFWGPLGVSGRIWEFSVGFIAPSLPSLRRLGFSWDLIFQDVKTFLTFPRDLRFRNFPCCRREGCPERSVPSAPRQPRCCASPPCCSSECCWCRSPLVKRRRNLLLKNCPRQGRFPSSPRPGPSRGSLGAVLGASWSALGALLGPSWGALGRSWGPLGRLLGLLGAVRTPSRSDSKTMSIRSPLRGRFSEDVSSETAIFPEPFLT